MKNVTVTLDEETAERARKSGGAHTEDLQDGAAFGAVTARSPFTLEVREAAAAYAVERRARSLHRPRGRPKRAAIGA